MMGHREPMVGGDEYDALSSRSKGLFKWRAGIRKYLKRKFNKRQRREEQTALLHLEDRQSTDGSIRSMTGTSPK